MSTNIDQGIIVVGASAGGLNALSIILKDIPADFRTPILIVQHMKDEPNNYLTVHLNNICALEVVEANDKDQITNGTVFVSPPGYHMEVNDRKTISLSADPRVNYSRPSIDLLFISVADAYREDATGVILSGANSDGAQGAVRISEMDGYVIVQNPKTSEASMMPECAISTGTIDHVSELEDIASLLIRIDTNEK